MKRIMTCLMVLVILSFSCLSSKAEALKINTKPPHIQIAILLDTSGSMSGLIEQAKTQLWTIVNQFAKATKTGQIPELEVALFEYGKDSLPASEGYIRMITPLTMDLDKVSEELFVLKTNGGEEYCGQVIKKAVDILKWSKDPNDYKAIFIAGNEPFTQGPVDYHKACKSAIEKAIIVNTIHCGDLNTGINTFWQDGAMLADGNYLSINQNEKVVHIAAPQDKEIAQLNQKLNSTYIAFGAYGREGLARQQVQDSNAMSVSASIGASRAATKASQNYRNSSWDLVDAVRDHSVKLEDIEESQLPQEMKSMNQKERKAYVEKNQKIRNEIQDKIKTLSNERQKYINNEMKKRTGKMDNTLGDVIVSTINGQMVKRGFEIKKVVKIDKTEKSDNKEQKNED